MDQTIKGYSLSSTVGLHCYIYDNGSNTHIVLFKALTNYDLTCK